MKNKLIGIGILFALFIVTLYVLKNRNYGEYKRSTKMYRDFGIRLPNNYDVHGIDISHHQSGIDWKRVKKMKDKNVQLQFAIIKSTEGYWLKDKLFNQNWRDLNKHDIKKGAYLYLHPNHSGSAQANFFILNTPLKSGDLAPVIDIEETKGCSVATIQKELKACIAQLKKHYKCEPIIYCGAKYYNDYLTDTFDGSPLWVAHYYQAKPAVNRNWDIWQHNDKGNVNGINGDVDFNVVNGGMLKLNALCIP